MSIISTRELAKNLNVPHRKVIEAVKRWIKSASNYNNWYSNNKIYQYLRISTYIGKKDKVCDEYILNEYSANIVKRFIK